MAFKRVLAGVTILICLVVFLASVAGGIGIWIVKESVTSRATRLANRIESGLDFADRSLDEVGASLATAEERLESIGEKQRTAAQNPLRGNAMRRLMARTVQQQITPELGDAHEKIHSVAEAVAVASSVLGDVDNFPFLANSRLDTDRITEINRRLSQVESSAWELARLFGDADAEPNADDAVLSRIEQMLQALKGLIADYATRVKEVRVKFEEVKSRIFAWILPATILISATCFWIALSQISLFCHAWSWFKKGRNLRAVTTC
jgi:hypothetical protein